jgi:hypothetical protein
LAVLITPASSSARHEGVNLEDLISGSWDLVINSQGDTHKMDLTLKLDGENVSGSFASSTPLGNGPVSGTWANGKLALRVETSHATLSMTGATKNGKLAGDWETGQMSGKWEASRKKGHSGPH